MEDMRTRGEMICPENGNAMKGFMTVFRSCYGRNVRGTLVVYVDDWFGAIIIQLSIVMPLFQVTLKGWRGGGGARCHNFPLSASR